MSRCAWAFAENLAERATASVAPPKGGLGASEASPPAGLVGRVPARRVAPLVSAPRSTRRAERTKKKPPTKWAVFCSHSASLVHKACSRCLNHWYNKSFIPQNIDGLPAWLSALHLISLVAIVNSFNI